MEFVAPTTALESSRQRVNNIRNHVAALVMTERALLANPPTTRWRKTTAYLAAYQSRYAPRNLKIENS
jgi:hypothetical protein